MSKVLPQLLLCDDDSLFQLAVRHALKSDYRLTVAKNTDEAKHFLSKNSYSALLLDIQMRTENEGLDALPDLQKLDPEMPILMISGRTDFKTLREAMQKGARDYIPKDFDPDDLKHTLTMAIETQQLVRRKKQNDFETRTHEADRPMVGSSAGLKKLRERIEKYKNTDVTVIVTGESGTGKELVAHALRRTLADGTLEPFVAVDCSTLQPSMAESILFGHESGAFTGATALHRGLFEEANGGTLFLDEIANLSLEVQSKLLRVLQEREIVRLGSTRSIALEFRIIAATQASLENQVETGKFKNDLFQRLNVGQIEVPPLRKRLEDLSQLLAHFAPDLTWKRETLELLKTYSWPGNIRQLENLALGLRTFFSNCEIAVSDLPPNWLNRIRNETGSQNLNYYDQVEAFEKSVLIAAHEKMGGNVSKMAENLGMDRSHLHGKLKSFGIRESKS